LRIRLRDGAHGLSNRDRKSCAERGSGNSQNEPSNRWWWIIHHYPYLRCASQWNKANKKPNLRSSPALLRNHVECSTNSNTEYRDPKCLYESVESHCDIILAIAPVLA